MNEEAFNEEVKSSERLISSSYVNEHCLISIQMISAQIIGIGSCTI